MDDMTPPTTGQQEPVEPECLAWYRYPEPRGTAYDAQALSSPAVVEEVFGYCQILLAIVLKEGWRFLFKTYGLSGILAINERSGWFDTEDCDEARERLFHHCRIAGYDPIDDVYGTYDGETGRFTPTPESS